MEQPIEIEEEKSVDVPLLTKLGMVAAPLIPTLAIDALFHGGVAPPALIGFVLSYLSFDRSPKAVAWLGENKPFLSWLAEHPDMLRKVDCLSRNYFSQQLAVHHLAGSIQPKDASVEEMEPLQPIPHHATMHIGPDSHLRLHLAPNFQPDINMVLREGIFACGVKGSGKTGVMAKIVEQITLIAARFDPEHLGVPLVVFDKEGDLESLASIFPNGCIADQEHWYTAEDILTQRLQVVVNLQAWLKAEESGKIMVDLVNDLIDYSSSLDPNERLPCPVFLDEAQYWLPQDSISYLSKETQKELLDAFGILLNTGRKRGLTPFIFTQRIAQIDKSVISLGIQIFMRQVIDNDQKRCMEYIRSEIIGDRKNLAQLSEGQGIACLPKGVQLAVQFDERQSTHLSHAPTVDRILARNVANVHTHGANQSVSIGHPEIMQSEPTHRRAPELRTTTQEHPTRRRVATSGYEANQRRKREETAIRREWHSVRKEAPANEPRQAQAKQDEPTPIASEREISLQEAFRLWSSGSDSVRDLAKALDITPYQANKLYTAMVEARMIEPKRKVVVRD